MVLLEDLVATRLLLALRHPKLFKVSRDQGWNIAHFVAACGTAPVMKEVLQTNPHLFYTLTLDGKTLLHLAFEYDNIEVARFLVIVLTNSTIN